jgi:two-component system sensor histidine kinase BaeS
MAPFVAEPALLYTGTTERFDPFSGDGWWRTTLAGSAVLATATGVTVLAGRRLTRPIGALTAAAGCTSGGGCSRADGDDTGSPRETRRIGGGT